MAGLLAMGSSLPWGLRRCGDRLDGFEAKWTKEAGWERLAISDNAVVQALMEGKGINKVAKEFGIGVAKVQKIRDKAKANGIEFEQVAKGGRPRSSGYER
jgi:nucleoside phosphorylase